jgi:hypothetical protein
VRERIERSEGKPRRRLAWLCFLSLCGVAALPGASLGQSISTGSGLRGLDIQRAGVKSVLEMRWDSVIRQHLDVGCGAAALATILTYHFDFPSSEQEMIDALFTEATRGRPVDQVRDQIQHQGFSLRNLMTVAQKGGLVAAGFKVAPEDLDKLKIPAITQVSIKGFNHFVVVRGTLGGRVYVADPAFGNTTYRLAAFEKIWSGVLLAFVARTPTSPGTDSLAVADDEKTPHAPDRIMRVAKLRELDLNRFQNQASYRFPLFPFINPQIVGTESVFPSLVGTRLEF